MHRDDGLRLGRVINQVSHTTATTRWMAPKKLRAFGGESGRELQSKALVLRRRAPSHLSDSDSSASWGSSSCLNS